VVKGEESSYAMQPRVHAFFQECLVESGVEEREAERKQAWTHQAHMAL
jgi:hypothetical protein